MHDVVLFNFKIDKISILKITFKNKSKTWFN